MMQDYRTAILRVYEDTYPQDLNIRQASERAGVARSTASTWIRVLVAEGVLEPTRPVGNAKMFRLRQDRSRGKHRR